MRVIIIASGGYLDKRIQRVLQEHNINGDISNKLTRQMMSTYDCVIFSYKNSIPNLPKVIETIVLEKKIFVLFISNTLSNGSYYNLENELFFEMVQELTLDISLPYALKINHKYIRNILQLQKEKDHLKDELELLKQTNKAKRILIDKGFNEAESHKFIQQKAMEMRIPKRKLVNLIIQNKIDF